MAKLREQLAEAEAVRVAPTLPRCLLACKAALPVPPRFPRFPDRSPPDLAVNVALPRWRACTGKESGDCAGGAGKDRVDHPRFPVSWGRPTGRRWSAFARLPPCPVLRVAGPLRSVKRATDFLATATAKRDASSKALDESAARAAAALQQAALEAEPPAAARPAAAAAVGDPDAQPVAADTPPVLSHSGCSVDSGTAARLRCAVHPTADGGFAVKCGWSLRAGGVVSGSRAGVVQRDWRPSEGDWVGLFLLSEPAAEAVARAGDAAAQGAAAAAALTVPGRDPARDHWALEWASGDTSGAVAMTLPIALRERLADRPPRVVVAYVTSLDAVAGCAAPLELTGMGQSADGRARAALPADAPL
ncbi:unnamed protein product, partial [Symbiodinium sp. KB8]